MNIVQCTLKVCCLLVFYIEMTCFKQNYAVENIEFRWFFFLINNLYFSFHERCVHVCTKCIQSEIILSLALHWKFSVILYRVLKSSTIRFNFMVSDIAILNNKNKLKFDIISMLFCQMQEVIYILNLRLNHTKYT